MALADSERRAAAFIADQIARGHNPASTLAKGVIKTQARAANPAPAAAPEPAAMPPPRSSRSYDPVGAAMRRATSAMRAATARETALVRTPAAPAPIAGLPTAAPRRPRPDELAARLRAGTAAGAKLSADPDPRGLLRAWAQGP